MVSVQKVIAAALVPTWHQPGSSHRILLSWEFAFQQGFVAASPSAFVHPSFPCITPPLKVIRFPEDSVAP